MEHLTYPNKNLDVDQVLSQRTFDLAHAQFMSWQQAPGSYGGLHLHACWGESSVLSRRYHGMTVATGYDCMRGFIQLYECTGQEQWRLRAEDVVANLLFLQTPGGGFYHASGEFEPTYTAEQSCPIHQGLPILALLQYAAWPKADPRKRDLIQTAVNKHWDWFSSYWTRRGTKWKNPLPFPGFCGVTNQELVIVAALAAYARIYKDEDRYLRYGLPVLDTLLSPRYYHESIGLFERGDQENFAERSHYYYVIVRMLERIHGLFPDARIPNAIDNVCRQLFKSLHIGADGLTHFSWGARTDPKDKRAILGWIRTPYSFTGYPEIQPILAEYCQRHPDKEFQALSESVARTIASYVFADGTIPSALAGDDPLFAVASRCEPLWLYLLHRLGGHLQAPKPVELPTISRICGPLEFCTSQKGWVIFRSGKRLFAGLKSNPGGIGIGDEPVAGLDMDSFRTPQIQETVAQLPPQHA